MQWKGLLQLMMSTLANVMKQLSRLPFSEFGIRRRNREERTKNTAAQIELMKKKQREADISSRRRWRGSRYIGYVSISLLVLGGCYWLYTKYLY
jgi:hypothetical protein